MIYLRYHSGDDNFFDVKTKKKYSLQKASDLKAQGLATLWVGDIDQCFDLPKEVKRPCKVCGDMTVNRYRCHHCWVYYESGERQYERHKRSNNE